MGLNYSPRMLELMTSKLFVSRWIDSLLLERLTIESCVSM